MSEQATTAATTTPIGYTGEITVSVNVSNFEQALDWYTQVLGFELVYRMDEYGWGELKTFTGGVYIGLSQTEEVKIGGTVPTFGVDDIDAARAALERHGVRMDEIFEISGMVKLLGFYDPDGNPWMLAESLNDKLSR
jgi:catechol 2,3-dioxygenase-like lactoylglutathione lyase family enzyme